MFDEMRFLINVSPNIKNKLNSEGEIVNDKNPALSIGYSEKYNSKTDDFETNTYVINKGDTKNFLKNDVNKLYSKGKNPYLELLKFSNDPTTPKSLKLKSSDFAYLRDIGVMPINRLMILRRYPENSKVTVDLNDTNSEPISVVIGWVKKDVDLLNFTFNEIWEKQGSGDMLHLMIDNIIHDSFGVKISEIAPIPGWGLGFLFGILNKMGLTDYNKYRLPIGDPNLLKESITRPHESFGLESSFNFELETIYENKYIAGIDPTVVNFEILNNLLKMGTSDVNTLGNSDSEIIDKLKNAGNNANDVNAWTDLIGIFVTKFNEALKDTLTEVKESLKTLIVSSEDNNTNTNNTDKSKSKLTISNEKTDILTNAFKNIRNSVIKSILASTLARYKWPLRGSIGMFTGDATTPWHLTIGNPYAPLLSMNNIYCKNVGITYGKDMGFNDIPKTINVKVSLVQGRSLGKQEIYNLFGVRYKRLYHNYNKIRDIDKKPLFEEEETKPGLPMFFLNQESYKQESAADSIKRDFSIPGLPPTKK
jgi:hypothetical protein